MLTVISLFTPLAACMNVSSITNYGERERERGFGLWEFIEEQTQMWDSCRCVSHFRCLFKHGVEVAEATPPSELSKDLPEQLFWVHGGPASPVLLLLPRPTRTRTSRTIRVILLPLQLITEGLFIQNAINTPYCEFQDKNIQLIHISPKNIFL